MGYLAPELREIVDVFVDIYDTRIARPNEAVSIRRALRRSAASTVFASLGSHHPIVLRCLRAVQDAGRGAVLEEIHERLDVGGFAWAPAAEATGRAAQAALVADRISPDDHEALTAPWREALVERPRDVRPTLAPEFAAEHAAVEAVQRIIDTSLEQRFAAREVPGEAKLILAALRRFPRITSDHARVHA